jgi:hypothetical protein
LDQDEAVEFVGDGSAAVWRGKLDPTKQTPAQVSRRHVALRDLDIPARMHDQRWIGSGWILGRLPEVDLCHRIFFRQLLGVKDPGLSTYLLFASIGVHSRYQFPA